MTDDSTSPQTTTSDAATDDDTLEALASLPSVYHVTASPDGSTLAYYYDGTGRNELYVHDVETGERTQVSDGTVPEDASYPIAWDADGDRLFFHQDQDAGDEQTDIHAITLDDATEPVVETDGQTLLQDVSPDGSTLLYSTTATGQLNLHAHDVASGEGTQLTDYDRPVALGAFSPSGDRVAYRTNERDDLDNEDVYVMAADGTGKRRLDVGDVGAETSVVDWLPSGDGLLLADDTEDTTRPGIYDLETDDVTWYGSGDHEETPSFVLPGGDRFVAVRTRDCAHVPVAYDVDAPEAPTELDIPEGSVGFPGSDATDGVLADGSVLVTHESATTRKDVLAVDVDAATADGTDAGTADSGTADGTDAGTAGVETTETIVEADYGRFDPDDFAPCDVVTYESVDGLEIEALVYDSGERPSPAIVMVHGGPSSHEHRRFAARIQFLVDAGYSVMLPNYRGSTGRGREFKHRINGDWGGKEQVDVAEAGRWLKRKDWVDEDRVAVFGGSYGGYSTYMQLVQRPDFWTAGVAWVGMTDLQRLYEDSMPHFKSYLEQLVGDPEADADLYRDRSAITHVDELSDPLLMVHGVNDPRCPISQARLFRDALEDRGLEAGEDFEYEELGEEGHGSTDIDDKIRTFRLMADFFDRRL
jgi:dipeptidyl aminopeptidase/acylaminoacyl peptidase